MQQPRSASRRLSDFIHEIAPMATDGRAFEKILAAALNIPAGDVMALYRAYLSILELFKEAIAEGDSIENQAQKQLFLAPITTFQKLFEQNTIRSAANSFHLTEPTLSKLQYAAEFINTSPEQPIPDDVLTELMKNAAAMIEQIMDSDLPKYLKGRLIETLENLRFAINTYRLRGIAALRKATEEMAGVLVNNRAAFIQAGKKSEKSKKTLGDMLAFIGNVNAVIELATKLKELAAPLTQFFLPGADQ
jgi:hypothetical protein